MPLWGGFKIKRVFSLLTFFLFLSNTLFAIDSRTIDPHLALKYHNEIINNLKKKKAASKEYYQTYVKAQESLYEAGFAGLALKYTKLAIDQNYETNKIHLYVNVLTFYHNSKEPLMLKRWLKRLDNYILGHKTYKLEGSLGRYVLYKCMYENRLSSEVLTPKQAQKIKTDLLIDDILWNDLATYITRGQYLKAHKIAKKFLRPQNATLNERIVIDLLSVVSNQNKKSLLCMRDLKKYGKLTNNFAINLCRILTKPVDEAKKSEIGSIIEQINTDAPDMAYLNTILKTFK